MIRSAAMVMLACTRASADGRHATPMFLCCMSDGVTLARLGVGLAGKWEGEGGYICSYEWAWGRADMYISVRLGELLVAISHKHPVLAFYSKYNL